MEVDLSPKAAEIVACARTLLATGGYNGFSYADISERVGISKPSIHHHFASKAELVHTVVKLYRQETRAGLKALDQIADPPKRLQAYTGYWAVCIRDGTASFCVCAMLAAEMTAIPAEVADEVRGHFQDVSSWLASVLKAGAAKKDFHLQASAESEARALLATVHGAMLSARAYGNPKLFATIVQRGVEQLTSPR
jgi:TetR/AcrR family transcriptional repressor of nem operon